MKWSVSKSKTFRLCQRKWFYSDIYGAWNAKVENRREAYLLSNLQSIQAWRGTLVDSVIENFIMKKMYFENRVPVIEETIDYADSLIQKQLEFGMNQRFREKGMTKAKTKDEYAAFFDIEYKGNLDSTDVQTAINEIHSALHNLINSGLLQKLSSLPGIKIIPQRDMLISLNGFNVVSKPDLIVFYAEEPPLIIDWKVHAGRNTDYWLQLGIYAYVLHTLCSTKPHRDFPEFHCNPNYKPHEIELIEFQLLSNIQKKYKLSEDEICEIEDYISKYGTIMATFFEDDKLDPRNYQTTLRPSDCSWCGFKKLCWEAENNGKN
ncbi:MAG: hypothetical protein DAHOPDDO_00792 [Ignavibacteriaceae bacterium]|nr:hypothetical protein [Ignavibacteriaceae bacterium]